MSDEPKTADDGILDKARRMADRVGEYARSDEARNKLDSVRKRAIEVGGMATTGAKRLAEGTKQAAAEAKNKAHVFSKSEPVQAVKAKAKEDWDEIKGGTFRGFRFSNSPLVIALSIFLFFPLGLYLLWKHPNLGRSKAWWWAGGAWSILVVMAMRGGGGEEAKTLPAIGRGTARSLPPIVAARTIDCRDEGGGAASLSFSNDGRHLLVGRSGGIIEGYDVRGGVESFSVRLAGVRREVKDPHGTLVPIEDAPDVRVASFSVDGRSFAAWHPGLNSLKAWSVGALKECRPSVDYLAATDGAVSIAGTKIAVTRGSTVRISDMASGDTLGEFEDRHGRIDYICMSPDARSLVSASSEGILGIWDLGTYRLKTTMTGHAGSVDQLTYSADCRRIASVSGDSDARIWDASDGKLMRVIPHHTYIRLVALSPDGKLLATQTGSESLAKGDEAWHVFIHDADTGILRARLDSLGTMMEHLRFSPDGKSIVAIGTMRKLFIWEVGSIPSESALRLDSSRTENIESVDFSKGPNGEAIDREEVEYISWGEGKFNRPFYRDSSGLKRTHGVVKFLIRGRLAREEIHIGGNFKAEKSWDKYGRPEISEQYDGDDHHTREEKEYLPTGQLLMQKRFAVIHQPTATGERRLCVKAGSFPIYRPDGSLLEVHEFEDDRRVRVRMFDEYGNPTGDSGPP